MRRRVLATSVSLVGALALASACADVSYDSLAYGNPPGYRVHCLSGDSLSSTIATINGLSLDVSSPDAIDASVRAILESTNAPRTVAETPGATTDLTVDFTAPSAPLPELFYGMNLQWKSKYFLTHPTFRALVRNIRLDMLRFPGGQERVRYDKSARTSPSDELGRDQPYQYVLTGEDVANYVDFCRELGIRAEPEVDLYLDDPPMWAGLVDQIVNELGYDLQYVSAGNEPEVNNDSSWTYLQATSKGEAIASYMARYLRYHAAIEKVKPGLTYALGETGQWWTDGSAGLDLFLDALGGDRPGALSVHWYPLGDWGQSPSDPGFPSLEHLVIRGNQGYEITALSTVAATMRQKVREHQLPGTKLLLGEWGVAWSATAATEPIQDRLATALFVAEVNEYGKALGFDSLQYFSLSDPPTSYPWMASLIEVDGERVRVRPQYYVYLLYRHLYGDRIVEVSGGQSDDWSIYASKDDSRSYLMLINRTAGTALTKTVEVKTTAGRRQLRLTLQPHSVTVVSF